MSAAPSSASESKAPRPDPTNACGSAGLGRDADHEKKRDPHWMKHNIGGKRSLTSMPD